jgi:hypothetical protein
MRRVLLPVGPLERGERRPGRPAPEGGHGLSLGRGEAEALEPAVRRLEGLERPAQVLGRPPDRRRRVVELVGEAGREPAEGGELLALVVEPGRLTDAVGHGDDEARPDRRDPLEHLREEGRRDEQAPGLGHGAAGRGKALHPGVGQPPAHLARVAGPAV